MKSKRGEEMVEAALVLPLLILTILSLILLILYYHTALQSQTELHSRLLAEAAESKAVYKRIEDSKRVSSEMGGIVSMVMKKEIDSSIYVLRPAAILRTGELIGLD